MDLLRPREVAQLLRLSPFTIKKLIRQKKIPAIRIGGRVLTEREDLEHWVKGKKNEIKDNRERADE